MKKYLLLIALFMMPLSVNVAMAVETYCSRTCASGIGTGNCTTALSCNQTCGTVKDYSVSPRGYITINTQEVRAQCSGSAQSVPCVCTTVKTSYACNEDYYGTPTSVGDGACKPCPTGAECPEGNNSTFHCKENYYKSSATTCSACISNADCKNDKIYCESGYYLQAKEYWGALLEPKCVKCPTRTSDGATASTNSTADDITDCYLPANTTYTKTTGGEHQYQYSSACHYNDQ